MKTLILLFAISFSCNMFAQQLFVRVYNLHGKKINKGRVLSVTDSTLQLDGKRGPTTISVNNIGSIRTQHSAGHSIGLGATIGAASGGILAAIGNAKGGEDDYFDPGEIAIIFTLLGATTGAVAGTITAVAQNPHHYSIEGDPDKWKEFQTMVSAFNADRKKDKTASIF